MNKKLGTAMLIALSIAIWRAELVIAGTGSDNGTPAAKSSAASEEDMRALDAAFASGATRKLPKIVANAPAIPVFWVQSQQSPQFAAFAWTERATGDAKKALSLKDSQAIVEKLKEYQKSHPKSGVIVFLHGCCQNLPSAFSTASTLARDTTCPVILYSWPASPYKVAPSTLLSHLGYNKNEANCDSARTAFTTFFSDFETRYGDSGRIILVAHSMGNRLLDAELENRSAIQKEKPAAKLKAAMFTCADLPAQQFISHKSAVAANCETTWILSNNSDHALKLSAKVHEGDRLGAPRTSRPELLAEGVQVADTEQVRGKSHEFPSSIVATLIDPAEHKDFKLQPDGEKQFRVEAAAKP